MSSCLSLRLLPPLTPSFISPSPGAGATPWDLGGPTPIILHLSETGSLPKGRTLVPGCGTGYDVVAMACPDRQVVGLDISKTVVEQSSKV
ncbi:hypothetical protein N665_0636s0012 [Sinapis alba]|nr:hypothetical protein N665_0636s0012 [Sinapis alba]